MCAIEKISLKAATATCVKLFFFFFFFFLHIGMNNDIILSPPFVYPGIQGQENKHHSAKDERSLFLQIQGWPLSLHCLKKGGGGEEAPLCGPHSVSSPAGASNDVIPALVIRCILYFLLFSIFIFN